MGRPNRKNSRTFAIIVALLLVLGGLLYVGLQRIDTAEIETRSLAALKSATNRSWYLDGDTTFKPSLKPRLVFTKLRTDNVTWAAQADLVSIEKLIATSSWWSVVRGQPAISAVEVLGLELNLETDFDGNGNWARQGAPTMASTIAPRKNDDAIAAPNLIRFTGNRVRYRSGWGDIEKIYPIDLIELLMIDADKPVDVRLETLAGDRYVSATGALGSPRAMLGGTAFDVAMEGHYKGRESEAQLDLTGTVGSLAGLDGVRVELTLEADSLNDVGSISGIELPQDTPVKVTAVMASGENGLILEDYVLRIGLAIIRPQEGN